MVWYDCNGLGIYWYHCQKRGTEYMKTRLSRCSEVYFCGWGSCWSRRRTRRARRSSSASCAVLWVGNLGGPSILISPGAMHEQCIRYMGISQRNSSAQLFHLRLIGGGYVRVLRSMYIGTIIVGRHRIDENTTSRCVLCETINVVDNGTIIFS